MLNFNGIFGTFYSTFITSDMNMINEMMKTICHIKTLELSSLINYTFIPNAFTVQVYTHMIHTCTCTRICTM